MSVCLCHLLKTMLLRLQVKHPSEGAAAPPAMFFNDMLYNYAPSTYTQTLYTNMQVLTFVQSF